MQETHKKFDHPSIKCLRAKNQSTNAKLEVTKPKQNKQCANCFNYLSRCEAYIFSKTKSVSHINGKKIASEIYSYSSTCDTLLVYSIDALSWHTGNKDSCYAIAKC